MIDEALAEIVDLIQAQVVPGFTVKGRTGALVHQLADVEHVLFVYSSYSGPPGSLNADAVGQSFQVGLGARLSQKPSRYCTAFAPPRMKLDVEVNLGEARKMGGSPNFSTAHSADAVQRIAEYYEPYGRRWFARYSSVDKALATLHNINPIDEMWAGDYPALVAMRLHSERGEIEQGQQCLDTFVRKALIPWNPKFTEYMTEYAHYYGVELPAPSPKHARWPVPQ